MLETHGFTPEIRYSLPTVVSRTPLQERVRGRFKALVEARDIGHEQLGEYLGLSRSAVTRLLNDEGSGIGLQHIERLCEFFQITPAEIMADPGATIQAVSPIEAAILDLVRKMNDLSRHSLLTVLEWPTRSAVVMKRAGRTPDHLSSEDAMVLSLYRGIEDSDAQAGIVMQMRAFVQAKQDARTAKKRGGKS